MQNNYSKRKRSKKKIRKKKLRRIVRVSVLLLSISMLSISAFKLINKSNIKIYNNNNTEDGVANNKEEINDSIDVSVTNNNVSELKNNNSEYLSLENDVNANDAKEVQEMLNTWNYLREDGKKIAYLTFDDGPSEYVTDEILDILKEKDVKATFFVLGSMVENNDYAKEHLKRIAKEGHAIGNHGYSHKYDVLYPDGVVNAKSFMNDMQKSENAMKNVLGENFETNVIRFPGGHSSWNTFEIDNILTQQGYSYVDWNTLNGDAEGQNISADELCNRLKETVSDLEGNNDVIVVLMHDTDEKKTTADALGNIIDYLKNLGYVFKTLK